MTLDEETLTSGEFALAGLVKFAPEPRGADVTQRTMVPKGTQLVC
jgi:hypothetical protein